MARIAVEPEELQSIGVDFAQAGGSLNAVVSRAASALGALEWAARSAMAVDAQVNEMRSQAGALVELTQSLGRYLQVKAAAFAEADGAGADDLAGIGAGAELPAVEHTAAGAGAAVAPWLALAGLLRGASVAMPVLGGLGWLSGLIAGGPAPAAPPAPAADTGVLQGPPVPDPIAGPPVPPPPGPEDTRLPNADEVRFMQRVFGIDEDGYGPKTKAAVRDLQARNHIPIDAAVMIGPLTWAALLGVSQVAAGSAQATQQAPNPVPAAPSQPADADPFWQGVGAAPVVTENGHLRFRPEFQEWADAFNAQVEHKWRRHPDDYAGNEGADHLAEIYRLTPDKLQQLWAFSKRNNVDPRLMLSILKQEGTGSFDTNAANSAHFDGHGPQPDWTKDMEAALEGPVLAKLRLYPHAVKGGFPGSWVQWINWHTPIDSPGFQGGAGVYAEDVNWGAGVERNYRDIVQAAGGSGDPVQAYSDWMGQHADRFQPRHIDGDFVIKPGLAPGEKRPRLALWGEYSKPDYPGTTGPEEGFWRFPAPDEFCWHMERK